MSSVPNGRPEVKHRPPVKIRYDGSNMSTALQAFTLVAALELLVWLPPFWRYRAWTARLMVGAAIASSAWLFIEFPTFLSGLLMLLAGYRVVNLGRVISGRIQEIYLRNASWRTAWWLAALEVIILFVWWQLHLLPVSLAFYWYALFVGQLGIALLLFVTTLRHLWKTRPPKTVAAIASKDLPTLTVAIPARNETDDLEACLQSLIASDYPKLEILVLDDCSQNRRTPEIIRGYAHDGVRFIAGHEADEGWLPKNQAYERLVEESNGELIMFCGVDARFKPESLRLLVETMLQKNKSMMSIMPKNLMPAYLRGVAMLVQPMRYAWEMSLPRKVFRRPPVLSTCWIIQRALLESAGSFRAVTRSIVPESYFARVAVVHDGYSFMQSSKAIGIESAKHVSEQHDTATRTKYPQLHRRPELVFLLTVGELFGLILPVAFFVASFATPQLRWFAILSGTTSLLLILWYIIVVSLVYRKFAFLSMFALPFAVVHDVAVLNYSMLKYEFSVVLWKGRNVCVPVMRVEPKLPEV